MTQRKAGGSADAERDLQELLVRSLATLRDSPREREKFPALDRMLSHIKARQHRIGGRDAETAPAWRWLRRLSPPLTAAAAGFAGAALALAILPASVPYRASDDAPTTDSLPRRDNARESLDRSIRRLEDAIHGLENFQPLLESRIEWIEDEIQLEHRDAYVPFEARGEAEGVRPQRGRPRRGGGV